ncbi:CASP-like protein [Psidium guajava]|nr:CASP-like protein [Psidium guajava]
MGKLCCSSEEDKDTGSSFDLTWIIIGVVVYVVLMYISMPRRPRRVYVCRTYSY